MTEGTPDTVSRRTFIQTTAAASAAVLFSGAHIAGSDVIRVGLIGCGGRGTGAARDCLRGSEGVELDETVVRTDRADRIIPATWWTVQPAWPT